MAPFHNGTSLNVYRKPLKLGLKYLNVLTLKSKAIDKQGQKLIP